MTVKVGSRDSKLAVIQVQMVIDTIKKAHPHIDCQLITMSSAGDKDQSKALDEFKQPSLFSDQLEQALADKRIDIAVHSYKDLPVDMPLELPIVAVGERENPMDVLVLPKSGTMGNAPVGCSCKRRSLQFKALYPELETKTIRGSVISRLEQLDRGDYGALILAAAGLIRLGLSDRISQQFTLEQMIPSACQGILAVQGRAGESHSYLWEFHSKKAQIAAEAELAFVQGLEDKSYNNGVLAQVGEKSLTLTGMILLPDGSIIRSSATGSVKQPKSLGKALARRLCRQEGGSES